MTMGLLLATCQVLETPAEQELHAYAVPFFPMGCLFPTSEESVLPVDFPYPISTREAGV